MSINNLRRGVAVKLSPEGQKCLSPRTALRGIVIDVVDGLVEVRDEHGAIWPYHPDFLECDARFIGKPKEVVSAR